MSVASLVLVACLSCLSSEARTGDDEADAASVPLPGPDWEPTSSKAPASTVPLAPPAAAPTAAAPEETAAPRAEPSAPVSVRPAGKEELSVRTDAATPRKKIEHKGFVLQAEVGAMGCSRAVCRQNHGATPGVSVSGFVGGNIAGFVEIGVRGGYGKLGDDVSQGDNALALHGIDAGQLSTLIEERTGASVDLPLDAFNVRSASLSAAHGGLGLRVHLIPRGRVAAYVGSGVGYQLYRARYRSADGPARLDFHALEVPLEAGAMVYLAPHVALGARFEYRIPHYLVATIDHPSQTAAAPFSLVQRASEMMGGDLRQDMPHFWSAGAAVRTNF